MFRNTYQKGLLTIFRNKGSNPLAIWNSVVHNGHIKRVSDCDTKALTLEIKGSNVCTTYIEAPSNKNETLAIKLPYIIIVVKNLKKFFSFEIQIIDDKNMLRRLRFSNYQSTTRVSLFSATMPINLSNGWNQIQLNIADFIRRIFGTNYMETVRVQIHANIRLRRVYFCDRLYRDDEKPLSYRLYQPLEFKKEIKKKNYPYKKYKAVQRPSTPV